MLFVCEAYTVQITRDVFFPRVCMYIKYISYMTKIVKISNGHWMNVFNGFVNERK